MHRLFSTRPLAVAGAAAVLVGLALFLGCDRLGLGRGAGSSAEEEEATLPPARDPVSPFAGATTTAHAEPKEKSVETGAAGTNGRGTGNATVGKETGSREPGGHDTGNDDPPPTRAPGEPEAPEPEPLLGPDDLDKPLDPPPEAEGLLRMPDPEEKGAFQDLWVDKKNKRVVLAGRICKRAGDMELFACFRRTKEHESIVSVQARAYAIHAVLVAMGIRPGRPVQFFPEFRPAEGPRMEVLVVWTDAKGKRHTVRAQEWLRNVKTKKAMEQDWVFGGSAFSKDPDGREVYLPVFGDFICVSNFASAMFDIPINAPEDNASLLFEAFHERIPPAGTPVALILQMKPREPVEAPAK